MISGYQSEAHGRVSGYLRGSASLADLESWIWSFLGDLEDSHDEDTRNLAGTIGSIISEYSYGDRTEESMRKELAAAIRPFEDSVPVVAADSPIRVVYIQDLNLRPGWQAQASGNYSCHAVDPVIASGVEIFGKWSNNNSTPLTRIEPQTERQNASPYWLITERLQAQV
jgi:hypothetical protein